MSFRTLLVLSVLIAAAAAYVPRGDPKPKCVPISVEQCASFGYNVTSFPNFARVDSEAAAIAEFNSYLPLISVGCSEHLTFFLCASYFPLCNDKVSQPIGPCRPLCRRVRAECEGLMTANNFEWPKQLDCGEQFYEENNERHMCMPGNLKSDSRQPHKAHLPTPPRQPQRPETVQHHHRLHGECPRGYNYMNRTATCVPKCAHSHGFREDELDSARIALAVGAALSAALTSLCVLIACACPKRSNTTLTFVTRQSQRPNNSRDAVDKTLMNSAFCFGFSALVYLAALINRDQLTCFPYKAESLFVSGGISHVPCTLAAALLYFFGTAARLWWLCACAAWRRSRRRGGQPEDKQSMTDFLYRSHVISWAIPFVLLTVALMAQSAHADPLSRICLIGAVNPTNYLMFVLLRDTLITVCALAMIASGCFGGSRAEADPNGGFLTVFGPGFTCALLPLFQGFWLVAGVQHFLGVSRSATMDTVPGVSDLAKVLADPSLGALLGGSLLVFVLQSRACRSGSCQKERYLHENARYPNAPTTTLLLPTTNTTTTTASAPTNSQRSSANLVGNTYGNGVYGQQMGMPPTAVFAPPQQPPPPPPLAALRTMGSC